jgi:glucose-1-phosphate cytidylyltransferase
MKVLILAGGLGTRLSEATHRIPKPMAEIGGFPILWHIMKLYSHHGFNDFVILLGYKGFLIKQFFANYFLHQADVTIDLARNEIQTHESRSEPWKVTLLETGQDTMTGGRIKRAAAHVGDQPFLLTYGDGVADVDLTGLMQFHKQHGKAISMTTIQPEGRFGLVEADADHAVHNFREKPKGDTNWINGGFFVCEPKVLDYIPDDDKSIFEREPLQRMAADGELHAFQHHGFWQCMDTLRDHQLLNRLWDKGDPVWKVW